LNGTRYAFPAAVVIYPEQRVSANHIFYCQTQLLSVIAILFNFNCLIDEADSFCADSESTFLNGFFDDPATLTGVIATGRLF
jgi:hypothetical protein